jgi:RNA polymerase sigma-70 factor (ECF subfamily)
VSDEQRTPPTPDRDTFRAFYEAHIGAVYRFIYSRVGNREEAEDLTAQVFIKALRGMDWSRDEAALVAWLFQVARTTLADHWRAQGRIRTLSLDDLLAEGWDGPTASDPPALESLTPIAHVEAILQQLPPNYREVLRCRFLLNYSIKETAQHLNLTEANVKVLQLRALRRAAELHAGAPTQPGAEQHHV